MPIDQTSDQTPEPVSLSRSDFIRVTAGAGLATMSGLKSAEAADGSVLPKANGQGLLQLALDAHGGIERWRKAESVDVKISLTGGLYQLKGFPEGVPNVTMRFDARKPVAMTAPYGRPDHHGYFTPERVWIEDRGGKIVEERMNPRDALESKARETPWDNLDRLYFTSYAMWNYITTPFLLAGPDVQTTEIESHQENGDSWRRLLVRCPASIPTHSEEQTFYFNDKGLLQRLDYTAVAPASHYCFDHANFRGITIPTFRRVVVRTPAGPRVNGPSAVLIAISDVSVNDA